jgi:glycosyltransferase involved in cell wall biosynthesis
MPRFDTQRFDVKLYAVKQRDAASRAAEEMGLDIRYLGNRGANPSALISFLSMIKAEKPDILHLHGWIAANYGRIAGRMTGVPTIMNEHGVSDVYPMNQKIADMMLSRFTDTALAVSEAGALFLTDSRRVDPTKVRVLYQGIPVADFQPVHPAVVVEEKQRLGIPAENPVIGTIARMDVQKGVTYILQAIPRVLDSFPDARFLIVGDGPELPKLKAEASDLDIGGSVVFTGYRSDIPCVQSIMDVQVIASLWEAASLTVFEAMSMGRALIATKVGGLNEILQDGCQALMIPPADAQALGKAVVRILKDPELAASLRENGIATSRKYDVAHVVRNMEALYEEICAR